MPGLADMDEGQIKKIKGVLERITYQNEENGFTVARFMPDDRDEVITLVGTMAGAPVGSSLAVSGRWHRDSRHGWQLKVENYTLTRPNTINGIERYLGSGLIKGVGPGYAARIVGCFGLETLKVLEDEPERLKEVAGLGSRRIAQINEAWGQQRDIHRIMVFLQSYDISAAYAVRIFKTYGNDALEIVKGNPYRLAEDIWGIGFRIADRIALSIGVAVMDPRRIRAGLLFALNEAAGDGHCFLNEDTLFALGSDLLDPEGECAGLTDLLQQAVPELAGDDKVVEEDERIYLAPLYYAEIGVANRLGMLAAAEETGLNLDIDKAVAWAEAGMKLELAPEQKEALALALGHNIAIITGGPGTGKSTILHGLVMVLAARGQQIELAAPTGRAAKRLAEACGRPARTIHRLLEYDPGIRGFKRNNENPLAADYIIIDEASMLDVVLANSLLRSVAEGSSLLLVGDVDQLPSVGPGNILRDCIDSGTLPVARLSRIFRQGQGSLISLNAARINQGESLDLHPDYQGDKDFYFIRRNDPADIAQEIVSLCQSRLSRKFGFDPLQDIQVLTPMRKGVIGAESLNQSLQQALNYSLNGAAGSRRFYNGDKVMQIRNNYDKEVFNGDFGLVETVDLEKRTITVLFDGRLLTYESAEQNELELAYAVTVHKSQGSEFPCVIVPIHASHYPLLQRNLLYTGMTRGKQLVIIVGSSKAVAMTINNNRVRSRNSFLGQRLLGEEG